jgi:hypothetical protein
VAVGTLTTHTRRTNRTKGAFKRANHGILSRWQKGLTTTFTIWAHLEHFRIVWVEGALAQSLDLRHQIGNLG